MPYLYKAVLTAGYLYVVLVTINSTSHLKEDNDRDPAINININDSNDSNTYLKRQLKKYHWRQFQLHQQQQRHQQPHQHHHQDHTQTLELPRAEPLLETSQEITSSSGRTRSRALRHHSRSSSSSSHRVSISNIVGSGDGERVSGVGGVANGAPKHPNQNKGSRLLLQDREMRIEVFEDIIEKLLQLSSRRGSVQQVPLSTGILGVAMSEFWKEGPQKQWQQQLLQLYIELQQQEQRQQKQKLKEQQALAHKKPLHSIYVCPKKDSSFQLACPGQGASGATICIRDTELCDGVIHCPDGEDENSTVCMFYTMIRNAINKVTQTLFENLPRK